MSDERTGKRSPSGVFRFGNVPWTAIHNSGRKFENLREPGCRSSMEVRSRKAGFSRGPMDWSGMAAGLNNDRRWPQDPGDLQGPVFAAKAAKERAREVERFPISNKAEPRPNPANVSLGYDLKWRCRNKLL